MPAIHAHCSRCARADGLPRAWNSNPKVTDECPAALQLGRSRAMSARGSDSADEHDFPDDKSSFHRPSDGRARWGFWGVARRGQDAVKIVLATRRCCLRPAVHALHHSDDGALCDVCAGEKVRETAQGAPTSSGCWWAVCVQAVVDTQWSLMSAAQRARHESDPASRREAAETGSLTSKCQHRGIVAWLQAQGMTLRPSMAAREAARPATC